MKKGTSFYLEEDILEEIELYRAQNGLKSKNTALERLILDYKNLQKELEYAKALADYAKMFMGNVTIPNTELNKPDKQVQNTSNNVSKKQRTIKSAYDSME